MPSLSGHVPPFQVNFGVIRLLCAELSSCPYVHYIFHSLVLMLRTFRGQGAEEQDLHLSDSTGIQMAPSEMDGSWFKGPGVGEGLREQMRQLWVRDQTQVVLSKTSYPLPWPEAVAWPGTHKSPPERS